MSNTTMPRQWRRVALGDVLEERLDRAWPGAELLSVTSDRGVILQSDSSKRDTSSADKSKYKRVCVNDITYNTMRMWQGVSALSHYEGIVSPAYTVCRPISDVEPRYMAALLKHPDLVVQFHRFAQGLVDDTLNLKYQAFAKISAILPPLPEQRRIADILDTVDAAIQQTEALIAKLKLMKAGLLHDLLTRGLDEQGHLRDPSTHPEQFKDSPLGRIPRKWEATTVGELGVWRGGSTPSKEVASNWSGGTILWVSPKDIRGAEISDSEDKITERALAESTLSLFNAGDVLVVFRSGILRHTFPVAVGVVPFTVNQDIKVLAVRPGIYRRFAFYALQAMSSKVLSLAVKAGTTVESIDYRVFSSLPLVLPPEREQQQIVAMLDAHDARLRTEEAYCDKLKQLKKGLMHDLLTGRVRVQAKEAAR